MGRLLGVLPSMPLLQKLKFAPNSNHSLKVFDSKWAFLKVNPNARRFSAAVKLFRDASPSLRTIEIQFDGVESNPRRSRTWTRGRNPSALTIWDKNEWKTDWPKSSLISEFTLSITDAASLTLDSIARR